jgi:hypothetical protein
LPTVRPSQYTGTALTRPEWAVDVGGGGMAVRSMAVGAGVVGVAIGLALLLVVVLSGGLVTVLLGAFATDGPP